MMGSEDTIVSGVTYRKGHKYQLNELPTGAVVNFVNNGASFRVCNPDGYGIWVANEETGKTWKYAPEAEVYLLRVPLIPATKTLVNTLPKRPIVPEIRPLNRFDLLELE